MNCPKCGATKMLRDKPVYYNKENQEGDFLYLDEIYHCRICGKVLFVNKDIRMPAKKFVKGQVVISGYEFL